MVDKKVDNKLQSKELGPTFKKKMIHEVIVTTINENERVHIAPMGIKFVDHADKSVFRSRPSSPHRH